MSIPEYKLLTNEYLENGKMYSTVDTSDFVKWLEEEMRGRGMSQADLAREAHVSRGAIGNVLRGERNPGKDLLTAIAEGLKLPPETVFRMAGVLPPEQDDSRIEKIKYYMAALDDVEKNDVVAYAEMKYQQASRRESLEELRVKLAAVPPERKSEVLDLVEERLVQHGVVQGRARLNK